MKTPQKRAAHQTGGYEEGATEEIIFRWVLEGAYKLSDKVHSGQEGESRCIPGRENCIFKGLEIRHNRVRR